VTGTLLEGTKQLKFETYLYVATLFILPTSQLLGLRIEQSSDFLLSLTVWNVPGLITGKIIYGNQS